MDKLCNAEILLSGAEELDDPDDVQMQDELEEGSDSGFEQADDRLPRSEGEMKQRFLDLPDEGQRYILGLLSESSTSNSVGPNAGSPPVFVEILLDLFLHGLISFEELRKRAEDAQGVYSEDALLDDEGGFAISLLQDQLLPLKKLNEVALRELVVRIDQKQSIEKREETKRRRVSKKKIQEMKKANKFKNKQARK